MVGLEVLNSRCYNTRNLRGGGKSKFDHYRTLWPRASVFILATGPEFFHFSRAMKQLSLWTSKQNIFTILVLSHTHTHGRQLSLEK